MTVKIKHVVPGSRHRVRYGDEFIAFERKGRASSRQRLLIKVEPDCRVEVLAPPSATDEEVREAVRKRAGWIWKQLESFRSQGTTAAKRYVGGESHLYLGKQHVLRITPGHGRLDELRLYRGRFEVNPDDRSSAHLRELFMDWYRRRAVEVFERRLEAMADQALWLKQVPELSVRTMHKQWGNCTPSGRLTLNMHLVKAPRECIDYVILHELCHLAEHNHSKRFYRLMAQVMPGWEDIKKLLDSKASTILAS